MGETTGIFASGWKDKHHQHKLQWVKPPRVQVGYLYQWLREKHHHRKLLTFAPCTLTFAPCACCGCHRQQLTVVVFLPQPLVQIPHLHTWWFHPLQLVLVVFILPPTGEDTGGFTHCYLRWWCLSFHPLAQIPVVSPIATCAGGVYPSTHWRRYCTCTRTTCTVWWWFFSGGGGGGIILCLLHCSE